MGEPVSRGWEYFEVAADVGVHAWGPDLAGAFGQALLGVFHLIVPVEAVEPREEREVSTRGDGLEALLVNFVNEGLYLHDIEGFVVAAVADVTVDEGLVHGRLLGEPFDPARHPRGTVVKGATFHGLTVEEGPAGARLRLVLDV